MSGAAPAAVSDACTLITLSSIDSLDVLRLRFGRVAIPPEIRREAVDRARGRPGGREVAASPWIETRALRSPADAERLRIERRMGPGEAEALQLCLELRAAAFLTDDRQAAVHARRLGIEPVRTVAVLIEAQELGLVETVLPSIEALAARGFRLTPEERERAFARLRRGR